MEFLFAGKTSDDAGKTSFSGSFFIGSIFLSKNLETRKIVSVFKVVDTKKKLVISFSQAKFV